jgi:ubiquinone/menaquinone biosynthesis C-methylase UbiE
MFNFKNMKNNKKTDYARIVYNADNKPITSYPKKLVNFLIKKFELKVGENLLELGPARGDFLKEFSEQKLKIYAADISDYVKEYCPNVNFKQANLEQEKIPFDDNYFDIVYTKSFVEHFYYPEKIFSEIFRVLKPGGKIITLTPHWKFMHINFYEDYTHRTPFTIESIEILQKLVGFEKIKSYNFRQLPSLWRFKFLIIFSELTRILCPSSLIKRFKWVQFSKEVMILSYAQKPKK